MWFACKSTNAIDSRREITNFLRKFTLLRGIFRRKIVTYSNSMVPGGLLVQS